MGFPSLWPSEKQSKDFAENPQERRQNKYAESFARSGAGHCRRMFWTERGYLGLAADGVRAGDLLCVFPAARVPFLIRGPVAWLSSHIDSRFFYHLVCEAFVHGVMDGELEQSDNLTYRMLHII